MTAAEWPDRRKHGKTREASKRGVYIDSIQSNATDPR